VRSKPALIASSATLARSAAHRHADILSVETRHGKDRPVFIHELGEGEVVLNVI